MLKSVRFALLTATAAAICASAVPAAQAAAVPGHRAGHAVSAVEVCGQGPSVLEPKSVVLTCADDGELAQNLHWTTWTASSATATGKVVWRSCVADCAHSRAWKSAAAQVTLSDPVAEPGHGTLFTKLTLHVTGPTPRGFLRELTFDEAPVPATASTAAPSRGSSARSRQAVRAAVAPSGTLGYDEIEGYWIDAGGTAGTAAIAAAITEAESSFQPGVIQPGVDYCGAGSDRAGWGLWQITCGNSVPGDGSNFQLLDPWNNAEAAVSKYQADAADGVNGFDPWSTYTSGNYEHFVQNTAPDLQVTDPGEYTQVNGTPSGTPASPAAVPGSTYGPTMPGSLNNNPPMLAAGTLVKSPDSAEVKVIIGGAGIAVSASDVSADGYDLSKIVAVTDAAFNALPAAPPDGTVVKDQSGANATVYVMVDGSALPVTAAEFTADGWSTKPLMGVPTSWLQGAATSALPSGTVVYNENGTDPSRYVMVDGVALPISGAEWTADGYNTRPLLGVPGTWLAGAVAGTLPAGTVVYNETGADPSRYVMIGGAALPISGTEWTADGYNTKPLMGVPGTWLAGAVANTVPNGTVVEDQAGTSANRYVMVGGTAALISASEWTGNGYNTRPLLGVPGTWLAAAAAAVPANGTLIQASGSTAVYLVTGGDKELLTASQFGTGGYSYSNVVLAPAALLAQLPTTTG